MSITRNVVAVDLGAESGRVALCRWDGSEGRLEEVYRFSNRPLVDGNHLLWDLERIWRELVEGLARAAAHASGRIDSIGIDGWGVDYVLLDAAGNQLGPAFCYRDARTGPAMDRAFALIPKDRIYQITGIQFMPFNTIYQLLAHKEEFPQFWEPTARWLTLPEYFQHRLTGVVAAEYTEASTTQLLEVGSRVWSRELAEALGLDLGKFPTIVPAGTVLGPVRPGTVPGLDHSQVIAPACHDTGSAVAGIPFPHARLAFISSGTWSLVGTVLEEPVVETSGAGTHFTNEGGVASTICYLQNVIGLWLLQECLREWNAAGLPLTPAELTAQCLDAPPEGPYFEAEEAQYLAPGNMVERINAGLRAQGFAEERRPAPLAAIILRSLARRYARALDELRTLTGKRLERVAIVGGGVKNEALNRLTELLTGLEVARGPSEAAARGNCAVQLAALAGAVTVAQVAAISARLRPTDS